MKIPRVTITGTSSGVGKTTITCAIIHGLKKKGFSVQPFKVGPDYIDPTFLSKISGNDTRNLDVWLMGKSGVYDSFVNNSKLDFSVVEGVMGFYDGFSGKSNYASTHHVSKIIESPVILILDASKVARSVAATALGFKKFHRNSRIDGLILNKLGSKKHEDLCRQALEGVKIPIIGNIPKNPEFSLQSRHLGLVPVIEAQRNQKIISKIAKEISNYLDIDEIIKIGQRSKNIPSVKNKITKKPKTTIAVALDSSFNFYYQGNLDSLRHQGAKLKFFSPISDSKVPSCDGLYIGGGFPEVLGKSLQNNTKMRKAIKKIAEDEKPIYAECGGLMYLTKSITHKNKKFKMVGVFDAETKMTNKMKLNYTKGKISTNSLISKGSTVYRGHEFHYSELNSIAKDSKFAYDLSIGIGISGKKDGLVIHNTLASYGHLYFQSGKFANHFVTNCERFSKR